jgi:hypothetical protein
MAGRRVTRRGPRGRRSGYGKENLTGGPGQGSAAPALPILEDRQ